MEAGVCLHLLPCPKGNHVTVNTRELLSGVLGKVLLRFGGLFLSHGSLGYVGPFMFAQTGRHNK